jgi:imidazolonepropionase-like amidohydrolase
MRWMKVVATVSGIALMVVTGAAQAPAVLFEGARLITGDAGGVPIENSAFVVQGNRFTRVGRRGEVTAPAGATRVDLSGKTVIPALIDAHMHAGYITHRAPSTPEVFTREHVVDDLRRAAYYGVAAMLSMGLDRGEIPFEVRANPIPGAALFRTAGRGIAMPKGGPPAAYRIDAPYAITNEADARKAVRELTARKVDIIKVWVDDRLGTVQKVSPALYRAVIDEAHKNGQRVIAHVYTLEDAKGLLRAGIDGFAHGVRDKDVDDELVQLFRQRPQVFLLPNLPERGVAEDFGWLSGSVPAAEIKRMMAAEVAQTREQVQRTRDFHAIQARNLARLNAAGVQIGFATDGVGAGWTAHTELVDMAAAGMTPAQVLASATRISAAIIKLDDHGTVAAGKAASFVVLDANPLDNIANARRIARVYLRGQEVDRGALSRAFLAGGTN